MPFVLSKNNFINFLICFIPISFIAGNLVLNLNFLSIIIFSLVFYSKDIIKIKFNILDKLILVFFSYILVISILSTLNNLKLDEVEDKFLVIAKSIAFFRFLVFYFIIRHLVENKILNFKFFFLVCFLCSLFVCFDIIYQVIFGKDIFGYELHFRRASGPFGDELIAGSYLQRFSIFGFFLIYFFSGIRNQNLSFLYLVIYLSLISICIIFSGNKMPMALFLLVLTLIFIFENRGKKFLIYLAVLPFLIFITLFYSNQKVKDHFGNFFNFAYQFVTIAEFDEEAAKNRILKNKKGKIIEDHQYYMFLFGKKYEMQNLYMREFYSGYKTWQLNKFIGDGVRSYKINCAKTDVVNCGPHPHNYILEILADLGLFGLIILYILFFKIIFDYFRLKFILKSNLENNYFFIPFFI